MELTFDPAKNAANRAKHGVSLADAEAFDLASAMVEVDARKAYGETRYRAFGRMGGRGYCLAFTIVGDVVRVISFRRAHEKEMARYER